MKTTESKLQGTQTQAVSVQPKGKKASTATSETTDFGRVMQTLLGKKSAQQDVSEEDLFAAAAFKVIKELHGVEMARDFKSAFKLARIDKPATEMFPSNERATKEALNFFVKSTILTEEQAAQVRDIAAQACQLDNRRAIWDEYGKSKSVTTFADAQVTIQDRLAQAIGDVGSESTKASTLSKPSYSGKAADAPVRSAGRRAPRGVKTVG